MSEKEKRLEQWISKLENGVDEFTFKLRKILRLNDPLQIVTYRSYGTNDRLYIKGRVLEDKGIKQLTVQESLWQNLLAMYRRFESDEVPGAQLKVTFQNLEHHVSTDKKDILCLASFLQNLY